jgi:hypothetical protein
VEEDYGYGDSAGREGRTGEISRMKKFWNQWGWLIFTTVICGLLLWLVIWSEGKKRNDCLDVGGKYVFDHWQSTGKTTVAIYVCVKEPVNQ